MESLDNLSLLLGMFNQYLFQDAKNNVKYIKYYYQTNPSTNGNKLVDEMIKAIETYDLQAIDQPLFESILARCNKTPMEKRQIMDEVIKWKSYTKEQIAPTKKYLDDIVCASIIQQAGRLYNQSPAEYIKYLKNVNIPNGELDVFSSTGFENIDINTIVAEASRGKISTNINWLNQAFGGEGINRAELGIITAPPGVGKSLVAMDLAYWMAAHGEHVLYVCLGDMSWLDFVTRISSIAFGVTFAEAEKNLMTMYNSLCQLLGSNLEISVNPAGVVTADDIVEKAEEGNFSVVIVDHDGNIAGATETDSMYNMYGDVYNKFTKLSLGGKLVICCSQAKVGSWGNIIGLESLSDSSRKTHNADWQMSISNVNPDCPNHLYVATLPKARRANVGSKAYLIRIQGRFKEIPKGLYDQLRMDTEPKNYTEGEIDAMIHNFNMQVNHVQQQIQQATQQVGQFKPGPNPFGKP